MAEKMKCARCGKRFKQANRKQVFCADCLAKERQAKKNAPTLVVGGQNSGGLARPSGANLESAGITIVQATPPPEAAVFGSRAREAERHAAQAPERIAHSTPAATIAPAPPKEAKPDKFTAPAPYGVPAKQPKHPSKAAAPQQEKRQRPPRPAPFELTDAIRATIEARYLELAKPVEFDGIRTQIAGELHVPKPVVKQVIQELPAVSLPGKI